MKSLQRKSEAINEDISVYGISDGSRYVQINGLDVLEKGEVYISNSFRDKYGISIGDMVTLDEKYENKHYEFKVAGFYDKSLSISVFMPMEHFRSSFDLDEDEFTGFCRIRKSRILVRTILLPLLPSMTSRKCATSSIIRWAHICSIFMVLCILLSAVKSICSPRLSLRKTKTLFP